ncbi:class A beta-lactamase-related serine hydrolase [Micromonospora sp. WMMD882]|uniref:serine hydrolase n=1 Tax=Micromonospora sp. WMMD882 TaxID=3015151 RepID=UPI00248CED48|nr:serine hydrolase [Micromonospora sp. WMMD882]WBB80105.1 class A beta-lactamase-related serine hydrolase [Micromonospora sp. WMMD882]
MTWHELDTRLADVPGTVSTYVGRPGATPTWTRAPHATHYAASTMKVAILAALHRAADTGRLDLDTPVPVRNDFPSARPDAPRFSLTPHYDNDDAVWRRLGQTAPLRWLAERMIVRSSNLATNILLGHVGVPAVTDAWTAAGARHSVTARGIEDFAAREAGISNIVTAADLAALLGALTLGATTAPAPTAPAPTPPATTPPADTTPAATPPRPAIATPASCAAMLDVLCAQQFREDLPAGLPPGTRIAHKNGWIRGIRHGAGVVFPHDAPPYLVVVCATTDLPDDDACRLLADISAQVWAARHALRPAA